MILKKLEQCRGNKELITPDWSSELADTEADIIEYEKKYVAVVIPEVEDIPFTPYNDSSPPEAPTDPEVCPEQPSFDEHGSMLGSSEEVLATIPEACESPPFTPYPERTEREAPAPERTEQEAPAPGQT